MPGSGSTAIMRILNAYSRPDAAWVAYVDEKPDWHVQDFATEHFDGWESVSTLHQRSEAWNEWIARTDGTFLPRSSETLFANMQLATRLFAKTSTACTFGSLWQLGFFTESELQINFLVRDPVQSWISYAVRRHPNEAKKLGGVNSVAGARYWSWRWNRFVEDGLGSGSSFYTFESELCPGWKPPVWVPSLAEGSVVDLIYSLTASNRERLRETVVNTVLELGE